MRFSSKRHHRNRFYHCLSNVQRGPSVCSNSVGLPLREIDGRVLAMFEGQLLDPDALRAAVQEAVRRLREGTSPGRERSALVKRLRAIKAESERLAKAIALAGGDLPTLVQELQTREHERTRIEADLRRLEIIEQARTLDARKIGVELETQLVDRRGLLRANVQQARQMLRKLMVGRLALRPTRIRRNSRSERPTRRDKTSRGIAGAEPVAPKSRASTRRDQ